MTRGEEAGEAVGGVQSAEIAYTERERAALAGEPGFCRHLNPERTHMCDRGAGHKGDCDGFPLPTIEIAEGEPW